MGVKEDIEAVEANPNLTPEEKRIQRYALKTGALLPFLQSRQGQTLTRNGLSVTLGPAAEVVEGGKSWLTVFVIATRDGTRVPVNNPLMFRDPPIGSGSNADLLAWAEAIVLDAIGG